MKQVRDSYVMHSSVSGFSLLFISIIFHDNTYGEVDYRVLYENDISLWYLTTAGNNQAFQLSKKLFDDKFFKKVIEDSRRLNTKIKTYSVPVLNEKNILSEWNNYVRLFDEFTGLYRFCEQPFQQALEQAVLKYIPEKKLIEYLSNQDKAAELGLHADGKDALDRLLELGKLKLEIHLGTEAFTTTDFMKFIEFASKKKNVSLPIAQSLTEEEFVNAMKGKYFDIELAKERLKGCAVVKKNNKWFFESGKKYLQWKEKILKTQSTVIKGNVAFEGRAVGKVVKHMSWTGVTKLEEGDILVAGMTNPQMIPYLKKAGAIVTDEGGITCHAAIISRELKKPCITGTKNATRLLNNSDIVEVDAYKGVVNILKKA